jgi:hypothetical protein
MGGTIPPRATTTTTMRQGQAVRSTACSPKAGSAERRRHVEKECWRACPAESPAPPARSR